MQDKNGIEIKTGDIVKISGAYFKNDNGLYFVTASPGDPSWCGSSHSLKRISKAGRHDTPGFTGFLYLAAAIYFHQHNGRGVGQFITAKQMIYAALPGNADSLRFRAYNKAPIGCPLDIGGVLGQAEVGPVSCDSIHLVPPVLFIMAPNRA